MVVVLLKKHIEPKPFYPQLKCVFQIHPLWNMKKIKRRKDEKEIFVWLKEIQARAMKTWNKNEKEKCGVIGQQEPRSKANLKY